MFNIILKCQKKTYVKKIHSFHHYSTWFLVPMCVFAPSQALLMYVFRNMQLENVTSNTFIHVNISPKLVSCYNFFSFLKCEYVGLQVINAFTIKVVN
jgi:hypothetical protein